ncbi:MAG: PQQ-dependent sugar dehydrogenase [Gemmatimonadales bacterium]
MNKTSVRRAALALPLLFLLGAHLPPDRLTARPPACDATIVVPAGFCAVLFAEGLASPRHIVVAPNGDLFAASARGGVIALRDADGDGVAETRKTWGADRGTGIALAEGYLWFATSETIYRWRWAPGQLEPAAPAEVVIEGLPTAGHSAKPILVKDGSVYVDIGSATNSCQEVDRTARSAGRMPCTELETRAGIWRFSSTRLGQRQADGVRFATGLRNPMAFASEPRTGVLWMATHGRDQLGANWGWSDSVNAELPAEEFGPIPQGADYGWPYCFYDQMQGKKVLNPEYGGDGTTVGDCATKAVPAIGFPGHWAPIGLAFYTADAFPSSYRGGAFLAFHGSWNREPLPQAGYRVVFVPFRDGRPSGPYLTFMQGAGSVALRPIGLAIGPDGSLFVSSDGAGKVWKVAFSGGR